jgi:hypothetical protein
VRHAIVSAWLVSCAANSASIHESAPYPLPKTEYEASFTCHPDVDEPRGTTLELVTRCCELGACAYLHRWAERGQVSKTQAHGVMARACEVRPETYYSIPACNHAWQLSKGLKSNGPPEPEYFARIEQQCAAGNKDACGMANSWIKEFFPQRAKKEAWAACEAIYKKRKRYEGQACDELAFSEAQGSWSPPPGFPSLAAAKAIELRKECKAGKGGSCQSMLFYTLDPKEKLALEGEATEGAVNACERSGDGNACAAMTLLTEGKPEYAARLTKIHCKLYGECAKLLEAENNAANQALACSAGYAEGCLRLRCEAPSRDKYAQLGKLCSDANPIACVCYHAIDSPIRKKAVLSLLDRSGGKPYAAFAAIAPNAHDVRVRQNKIREPFRSMYDSCSDAERDINEKGKLAGIKVECTDPEGFTRRREANKEKYEREQKLAEDQLLREQTAYWCACKS